jgi:hypothetical protein
VDQTEHQQREHAAVVNRGRVDAALGGSRRHQHNAGAEQPREDRHELLVEEQVAESPHAEIGQAAIAERRRVEVGGHRHREHLDVHDQDAQQRDAAKQIDGLVTLVEGDGRRGLGHGRGAAIVMRRRA